MVKEVLVGEIVKAVRLPVSGGIAPARLEITVGGLKGLSHTLLGELFKQQGIMEVLLDPHIMYDLSLKLANKKVGGQYFKSQRVAKNRLVSNLDVGQLVGKKISITLDLQL